MEQATNYQIQIQHLFCDNYNNAKLLCCKDKCQNCALICRYETCNCLMKQHSECQFVYNYGLNEDQIKFINAIIQNNRTELNGNLVYKIKNNLSQENNERGNQWFNENEVKEFWKREQIKLQKIRKNLIEFYCLSVKLKKQNNFQIDFSTEASKNFKFDQQTKIVEKINGNGEYHCLVGLKPLKKSSKVNFQLTIINTQVRDIMIGIATQVGKTIQKNVYKSKEAILYFAYNGEFYNRGIGTKLGAMINQGTRVKVQVNRIDKQISWYSNNNLLGSTQLNERFINENIYAMIEMGYKNDSIRIEY